jgi:hypothetical protein
LAEVEKLCGLATEGVFDKFFVAIGAEIVSQLAVDVGADLVAVVVVELFEDILDFLQVVAIVAFFVVGHWIEGGIDLHLDDVTEIFLGIEVTVA